MEMKYSTIDADGIDDVIAHIEGTWPNAIRLPAASEAVGYLESHGVVYRVDDGAVVAVMEPDGSAWGIETMPIQGVRTMDVIEVALEEYDPDGDLATELVEAEVAVMKRGRTAAEVDGMLRRKIARLNADLAWMGALRRSHAMQVVIAERNRLAQKGRSTAGANLEAADLLGVSAQTVRTLVPSGSVPGAVYTIQIDVPAGTEESSWQTIINEKIYSTDIEDDVRTTAEEQPGNDTEFHEWGGVWRVRAWEGTDPDTDGADPAAEYTYEQDTLPHDEVEVVETTGNDPLEVGSWEVRHNGECVLRSPNREYVFRMAACYVDVINPDFVEDSEWSGPGIRYTIHHR